MIVNALSIVYVYEQFTLATEPIPTSLSFYANVHICRGKGSRRGVVDLQLAQGIQYPRVNS